MKYFQLGVFGCIGLGLYLYKLSVIPATCLLAGIGVFVFLLRSGRTSQLRIFCVGVSLVLLGILLAAFNPKVWIQKQWDTLVEEHAVLPLEFSGYLLNEPQLLGDDYAKYTLRSAERSSSSVWVYAPWNSKARIGDALAVRGVLQPLRDHSNPGSLWNEKRWAYQNGVYAKIKSSEFPQVVAGRSLSWVLNLKKRIIEHINDSFEPRQASLVKALLLGERSQLDPEFREQLLSTNTLHLIAISGGHLVIIALFLNFVLGVFPTRLRYALLIILLWFYAFLVGNEMPVLRAVIMMSVFLVGKLLYRKVNALHALGLSGTILLIMDPLAYQDLGFVLSFGMVFGLLILGPAFWNQEDNARWKTGSFWDKVILFAKASLMTSVIAWFISVPFGVYLNHEFNYLSFLPNWMCVPIFFVLMMLLFVYLIASALGILVPFVWVVAIEYSLRLFESTIAFWHERSWMITPLATWTIVTWVLFFILTWELIVRKAWLESKASKMIALFLIPILLFEVNQILVMLQRPSVRATVFDVGQGDSILFEMGRQSTLLVDTGKGEPQMPMQRVILPYLKSQGYAHVDAVVITHADYDHIGGLSALLDRFAVRQLFLNESLGDRPTTRHLSEELRARGLKPTSLYKGNRIEGFGDTEIQVLNPSSFNTHGMSSNDRSIALLIQHPRMNFLLTGDIEEEGIEHLLSTVASELQVDIYKVPHHGDGLANQLDLLRKIKPHLAVISVGLNNLYGHPDPETLIQLREINARVHRTDRDGALQIEG